MRDKKNSILIYVIILVSIIWIGMVGWKFVSDDKADAQQQFGKKISLYSIPPFQKVFLEGKLQYSQQLNFSPDASKGQIDNIYVIEKQQVKKNQVLFTYKNEQAIQQYEDLKIQLKSLFDTQKLLKKQLADVSVVQVAAPLLQESVKKINNTEEMKKTIRTQISDNDQQQKRLNAQLNLLKGKQYNSITAPFPGVVSFIQGANDGEQKVFLRLTAPTLQAMAYVTEKDRQKIHKNQAASIIVYGTGQEIEGKLREVGDFAVEDSISTSGAEGSNTSLSNYLVYIQIKQQEGLHEGYHVQGTVTPDNELPKIPISSLMIEDGNSFIWKIVNGKTKKIKIKTLKWNKRYSLVKSGVKPGEVIVRDATNDIKEGDKIDSSPIKN